MATATATASTPTPQDQGLWCGEKIQVIGLTGEYSSGKTLFGLTICPGPETLVYDNEGSSASYENGLGFERVDVAAELFNEYPNKKPTAIQRWEWWLRDVEKRTKSKQYKVIMVDPVSELESGLTDWVMKNPKHFDCSVEQFRKSGGIFWGKVKDYWKSILDDLRTKCDSFVFTAHMRDEFKGNTPTGRREAKGKETLMELASLYLEMDRSEKKGVRPAVPAANVLKSRLAKITFDASTGDVLTIPILPPRLPKATPAEIRKYILDPPNPNSLKKDEKLTKREMSEDERLYFKAAIEQQMSHRSDNEVRLEELRLEREQRMLEREERKQEQSTTPPQDQAAELAARRREKTNASAIDAMGEGGSEINEQGKGEESRGVEVGNGGSATATDSAPTDTTESTPTEPIQLEDCTVDGIKQYAKNHNIAVPQLVAIIEYIGGEGAKLGQLTDDQLTEVYTALHNVVTERRLGGEPIDQTAPWEDQPGTTAKN